jgi:ribosomal protein S7
MVRAFTARFDCPLSRYIKNKLLNKLMTTSKSSIAKTIFMIMFFCTRIK